MSEAHARETMSLAQRVLLDELERAFGGDQGARIFVQAALRAARTSALPKEPGPLLDFVRAHLLGMVTGELGARGASAFLERVTAAMDGLPLATLYDSGVQAKGERDDAEDTTAMPVAVDVPIAFYTTRPPSAPSDSVRLPAVPPSNETSSGRLRVARLRVALAHDDRFGRVGIARQLLQAHCDVVIVDTFVGLATVDGTFPTMAVVHLGLRDVELLLQGMLARNPDLRVVAILANADREAAERLLAKSGVQYFQLAPAGVRASDLAALVRRLAFW